VDDDQAHAKFRAVVARVLEISPAEYRETLSIGDVPAWDSVKHFELVLELEEALEKKLPMERISELDSLPKLWNALTEC
jgi:acyl carrier protein